MAKRVMAIILAVSAGLVGCIPKSEQETFLAVCENILKDRLRSPSSYELVDVKSFRVSEATLDQWMWWNYRSETKEIYYQNEWTELDSPSLFSDLSPVQRSLAVFLLREERRRVDEYNVGNSMYAELTFSYDVANTFNTVLRATSTCTFAFLSDDGLKEALKQNEGAVFLDGETRLDWAVGKLPN